MFLFDFGCKILHIFNREVGMGLCLLGAFAVLWIVYCVCKVMDDGTDRW